MQWCLIGLALLMALLSLVALSLRGLPRVRLGRLLRGCAATVCLLGAAGLVALALLVAH